MLESILFKNVELILPDGIKNGDLLVKNGKISKIAPTISEDAELVINEKGLALMAGVIDPHVHFREPGHTHKEDLASGSRAAAAGGVTSFFEMPNTNPATTTRDLIDQKKQIASRSSLVNYNFFIAATHDNLEELQKVTNIPGIKIFVGSSTGNLLVDKQEDLENIFKNTRHLIAVHSEDEATVNANKERLAGREDVAVHMEIRSAEAAIMCTKRLVKLANKYRHHLHICHLTTKDEADFLAAAKTEFITTEVSPQHLLLNSSLYEKLGNLLKINPPIRSREHQVALFKALQSGVIDFIATDHAPHSLEEKAQPYSKAPSGMPGVETSLALMLDQANRNLCSLSQVSHWLSSAPAKIYNIASKGKLEANMDADLVLVDLNATHTLKNSDMHSKCAWTAFDGWKVKGKPLATFVNGQLVYREGDFFEGIKGKEVQILFNA